MSLLFWNCLCGSLCLIQTLGFHVIDSWSIHSKLCTLKLCQLQMLRKLILCSIHINNKVFFISQNKGFLWKSPCFCKECVALCINICSYWKPIHGCRTGFIDRVPLSLLRPKWHRNKPRSLLNRNMIITCHSKVRSLAVNSSQSFSPRIRARILIWGAPGYFLKITILIFLSLVVGWPVAQKRPIKEI